MEPSNPASNAVSVGMTEQKQLTAISFSHQNTGLDERDALSFDGDDKRRFVALCRQNFACEAAVLATCNRTEFYLYGPTDQVWDKLKPIVAEVRGLDADEIPEPAIFEDEDAARHLFRVASSLESVALGENEILGQVKEVHEHLVDADDSFPVLDQLFQYAIQVGKQVRTDTSLCEGALSISSAAVDLATKIFGDFSSCTVMVVGAGETAETAAMHFQSSGAEEFLVLNRSEDRGRKLASRFDGTYRPLDELADSCIEADVAVFATGAQDHLLTRDQARKALKARRHQPIFLIDISNPRNVDPAIAKLDSAFLYNMDDLQKVVEDNLASRKSEIPAACEIIDHKVDQWDSWQQSLQVTPTIASLAQFFEQVRTEEIKRHNGISEEKRQMLDEFSRGLVKKLLHNPIMYLRSSVDDNTLSTEQLKLVRSLYDLDSTHEERDSDET